MKYYIEVST